MSTVSVKISAKWESEADMSSFIVQSCATAVSKFIAPICQADRRSWSLFSCKSSNMFVIDNCKLRSRVYASAFRLDDRLWTDFVSFQVFIHATSVGWFSPPERFFVVIANTKGHWLAKCFRWVFIFNGFSHMWIYYLGSLGDKPQSEVVRMDGEPSLQRCSRFCCAVWGWFNGLKIPPAMWLLSSQQRHPLTSKKLFFRRWGVVGTLFVRHRLYLPWPM